MKWYGLRQQHRVALVLMLPLNARTDPLFDPRMNEMLTGVAGTVGGKFNVRNNQVGQSAARSEAMPSSNSWTHCASACGSSTACRSNRCFVASSEPPRKTPQTTSTKPMCRSDRTASHQQCRRRRSTQKPDQNRPARRINQKRGLTARFARWLTTANKLRTSPTSDLQTL